MQKQLPKAIPPRWILFFAVINPIPPARVGFGLAVPLLPACGRWQRTRLVAGLVMTCLFAELPARGSEPIAASPRPNPPDLLELSLEDLGQIKITSVSRKSQSLSGAATAIHVITQEDIRRSGVNSLPEALRMAPGLDVALAGSRKWAISSRGFNSTFANKLLVLMDGRTIYSPLFSGVFWEETDTVLEDVDRVEVIRGPGATVWGANAVNGVINIITKSAKETQGTLISGGGGIEERAFATVRYGGQLATNVYYRVYGKYANRDEFTLAGKGAGDSWWMAQDGFRLDWDVSDINRLTLQGDYYNGELDGKFYKHSLTPPSYGPVSLPSTAQGANILSRWTHEFSADSDMSLQMYYDRTDRVYGIAGEIRDTFDLDAQHRFHLGDRHEIVWGGSYRFSADEIKENPDFQMRDPSVGLQFVSAFVQDDITLVRDRLHLTLGTKVEHNDFTGLEVQPSGRVAWTPHNNHTVWGAVSRAVRTPSRSERGISVYGNIQPLLPPLPLPVLAPGVGNPDFVSEELLAYEIGYRVMPHPRLSLDCAAFYNDYDRLQSVTALPIELRFSPEPSPTPYLVFPLTFGNGIFGENYGAELSATWQPLDAWRLRTAYTFLRTHLGTVPNSGTLSETREGTSPRHQVSLWSDADLGRHVEWGLGLRYVDRLTSVLQQVPSYYEMEARLAWKPTRNFELAIVGRNLLHSHHREFESPLITVRNVEVDRSIYGKITLRF